MTMAKKKKKARPVKSSVAEKKKPRLTKHKEVSREKEKKVPTNTAPSVPPESREKLKNGKKRGNGAAPAALGEDGQKLTRLVLIKTRHEAIKREIDQIREDLESEEEE
jgi:hypothetical protein